MASDRRSTPRRRDGALDAGGGTRLLRGSEVGCMFVIDLIILIHLTVWIGVCTADEPEPMPVEPEVSKFNP